MKLQSYKTFLAGKKKSTPKAISCDRT